MKKSKIILLFMFCILNLLMGCATYKFQRGKEPHHKGYVVSRDDYAILEYTIGKDNSVPNLNVAKERFKQRRRIVEHYYKKMGYIENHFKMVFCDPAVFFLKIVGGLFRIPSIAISDYRIRHNPEYRARIRKIEDEKDAHEETRINKLKDELNRYIQGYLTEELSTVGQTTTVEPTAEQPAISK